MFDRPDSGEFAILVHIDFFSEKVREDVQEFKELVASAGVEALRVVTGSRDKPDPKYFIGKGKLEELRFELEHAEADVVLFNHALSPSQQRNLETSLSCRVIDRTGVILDIFAQRARTHEGKLQVELAQLDYMSTRLVRGWTHLERQKGGIGLRGPGETQLESDRRLLRARIKTISARLEKVRKQRDQGRKSRVKAEIPTVSLVGYTNAGKSTLFNRLTASDVYAADKLFATLDPTLRRLTIPDVGHTILVDTVGFIRHLPHKLVDAFRATLEETCSASLLLHIIDCHDDDRLDNIKQVELVLAEIGADEIPTLMVYNKLDLLDEREPRVDRDEDGVPKRVWLSAQTGQGLDLLQQVIAELLGEEIVHKTIELEPQLGKFRALLYSASAVVSEQTNDDGKAVLELRMQRVDFEKALRQAKLSESEIAELSK
ncbi:MAG: GTP-binding protein HflX [Oleiphilaceae bacterium]